MTRYLQFLFNLSLILIFLYLFGQFILTVQKDVEHRIAEYQQGKFISVLSPVPVLILYRCHPGD